IELLSGLVTVTRPPVIDRGRRQSARAPGGRLEVASSCRRSSSQAGSPASATVGGAGRGVSRAGAPRGRRARPATAPPGARAGGRWGEGGGEGGGEGRGGVVSAGRGEGCCEDGDAEDAAELA